MREDRVRFGIRTKLFLLVFVSFACLMLLIFWFVSRLATQQAEVTANQTLTRSRRVLDTRLQSRFASIAESGASLASDAGIRPRVYEGDSEALQSRMSDLREQFKFDMLMFTNSRGEILARSDKPDAIGKSTTRSSLFLSALGGEAGTGFMKRGSQLLQIVALPIRDNAATDVIRGTLGIAYLLSEELANEIQSLTGGEVAIFLLSQGKGDRRVELTHGTLDQTRYPLAEYLNTGSTLLEDLSKSGKRSVTKDIVLGDEDFLGSFYPLRTHDRRTVGLVAIVASKTLVLAPFQRIIKGCLAASSLMLVVGCALAFMLSRGVSKPIIELAHVTNRIRDGFYPPLSSGYRSDEIGILQRSVFEMGQSLKKSSELQEYLASFVEDMKPLSTGPEDTTEVFAEELAQQDASLSRVNYERRGLTIGSLFDDRYRIEQLLGAGGMGMVYRAKDQMLDEDVAIKLLQGGEITEEDEELFKQEIRLARKISHFNIVRTYDFGNCDKQHYISMELVPGFTLKQFIEKNGAVDLSNGIIMARQICAALSAAHAQGVVHRDLKTGNIIISRRGVLKIMDFGIAVAVAPRVETLSESSTSNPVYLPDSDYVQGTPRYMAPEQIRGKPQDLRVDIYATGILLFHLFTGEFPFNGSTAAEIARHHLKTPPPKLRSRRKDLPRLLEEIIDRALQKKPEDRFESAVEMGQALSSVA